MTMNINLTPQLESMVREKVSSGRYTSASEVVREALRLMEERDHLRAAKLEQLRRAISAGVASGMATPLSMEEVKAEGRRLRAAHTRTADSRD
jgi:antitoxin ParD1/3/4